jgi:hypothetical protein
MDDFERKHRPFRDSLRALLLTVTTLGIWAAFKVVAARKRHEAVAQIRAFGGEVLCDCSPCTELASVEQTPSASCGKKAGCCCCSAPAPKPTSTESSNSPSP